MKEACVLLIVTSLIYSTLIETAEKVNEKKKSLFNP
jgi:hypothetical protein